MNLYCFVLITWILISKICHHSSSKSRDCDDDDVTPDHGWDPGYAAEQRNLSRQINSQLARMFPRGRRDPFGPQHDDVPDSTDDSFGDVLLSVEQARYVLQLLQAQQQERIAYKRRRRGLSDVSRDGLRKKRSPRGNWGRNRQSRPGVLSEESASSESIPSIRDLGMFPITYWSQREMPIKYAIDDSITLSDDGHGENYLTTIRLAISHWENRTCLRFQEVSSRRANLLFMSNKDNIECNSQVGRDTSTSQQQIQLGIPECFDNPGTAVHEIGHAIGLYHEHAREDRDAFITVNFDNIYNDHSYTNFLKIPTETYGIPYDLASVMHYSGVEYAYSLSHTIDTTDEQYQHTIGQRIGLSFFDVKHVNTVYCTAVCSRELACLRGGYTDPLNCNVCRCPDGFSGRLCDESSTEGSNGCTPMSGSIEVDNDREHYVTSPGYMYDRAYEAFSQCNWWIQAPEGCTLDIRFDEEFSVFCDMNAGDICYHWVEIKHTGDLGNRDPRYCCYSQPSFDDGRYTLTTEANSAMIVFKSDKYITSPRLRAGFQLFYKISDPTCLQSPTTVTPTPTATPRTDYGVPDSDCVEQSWTSCYGRYPCTSKMQYQRVDCTNRYTWHCQSVIRTRSCKSCRNSCCGNEEATPVIMHYPWYQSCSNHNG